MTAIEISGVPIGPLGSFFAVAGPCVLESEEMAFEVARELRRVGKELGIPVVFKSSYDKANRSSADGYRGPGLEKGLAILGRIKSELGLPILTDVHQPEQCAPVAEVADILQIPAFLCRQTDLVEAAARTGRILNIKKGQFVAPDAMRGITNKAVRAGCERLMVTERGFAFGYHNLVVDCRVFPILRELGYPVLFDASHSVQLPGGYGDRSGGERRYIFPLARAAVASGADGLFIEVHPDPPRAHSDADSQLPLNMLEALLAEMVSMHAVAQPFVLRDGEVAAQEKP